MPMPSARSLSMLLLATTVLVAQWALAQHGVETEPHATHTSCEWCLTHAPLASGLPATAMVVPVPGRPLAPPALAPIPAAGARATAYVARAPPAGASR